MNTIPIGNEARDLRSILLQLLPFFRISLRKV